MAEKWGGQKMSAVEKKGAGEWVAIAKVTLALMAVAGMAMRTEALGAEEVAKDDSRGEFLNNVFFPSTFVRMLSDCI